jgi:ribosomal protein L11 methylase PrmA
MHGERIVTMIEVGPFAICGDWEATPTPPGQIRLIMAPSFAYSNGWSLWTQAGLLALAQHVKPGMTVLDMGTGSGILAIAAAKLGAAHVWAVDVHPEALEAAALNIRLNGVQATVLNNAHPPEHVDLAIVSIGSEWAAAHQAQLLADTLLIVHDDATVDIIQSHAL